MSKSKESEIVPNAWERICAQHDAWLAESPARRVAFERTRKNLKERQDRARAERMRLVGE